MRRNGGNMEKKYEEFIAFLEDENKEDALSYALNLLRNKDMDVIALYTNLLTPALNKMECKLADKNICIWKEHVRTAIVRTIVECCYPYVIEKKKELNYAAVGTAVILCPPEEYHDLGAKMVADFLTICGYKAIFVGSNTPYQDFMNAIDSIHPNIVAISVSNYYNLVATKKIIEDLRLVNHSPFKIIVGGYAFDRNTENYKLVGADYYANAFLDIERIIRNEVGK